MEIKGRVVNVLAKTGNNKNGEPYIIRDVLVEYQGGDYTKRVVLSVYSTEAQNKWQELGIENGKDYTFSFDIDAHEYNGRWFNSLRIWKATPMVDESAGTAGPALMSNAAMIAAKFPPQQVTVQQPQQAKPAPAPTQNELPF